MCGQEAGPIEVILATIRHIESGDNYAAHANGSSASGAYQFIDSAWNSYDGYTHAADAPPATQDAKATERVQAILAANDNDVTTIPVVWYIGHLPAPDSGEWDQVPAGNVLTPREYRQRWLDTYDRLLASSVTPRDGAETTPPTSTAQIFDCAGETFSPGGLPIEAVGGWAFPLPRSIVSERQLHEPHHDYPAIDILVPEGTPLYALTDGTVARTTHFNDNWWNHRCPAPGCDTCGVGLSVQTDGTLRYIYCHGSAIHVHEGDRVVAGQHILTSGNTGRSGAPHLHLELKVDGTRICPQAFVVALYLGPAFGAVAAMNVGCSF